MNWREFERDLLFFSLGLLTGVLLCLGLARPANGRDLGQWANMPLRAWFEALRMPDEPSVSCCGRADAYWCDDYFVRGEKTFCRITDGRADAPLSRPHVALGTLVEIPSSKFKFSSNDPQKAAELGNPTGHSVVFLGADLRVYCFVLSGGV